MSRAAGALAAFAIVVAACSSPGAATTAPTTAAAATTAPATTGPAATTAPMTALELALRMDAKFGDVVTGKDGLSLYVFTKDSGGKSACEAPDCASNWPALTVSDASAVKAGSGVTGAVGTITRTDGSLQVTLGGTPLYYFAGDSAAGQTNGQAIGGFWYVASPGGTPVKAAAGGPGNTPCSGKSCY